MSFLSTMRAMAGCEQAPGLSVLDHGRMVRERYRDLIGHLREGRQPRLEWRLPEWCGDPISIEGLPGDRTMGAYHLFHDCGKPEVLALDEDGRRHFPDHAEASRRVWLSIGGSSEIGHLIAMDMDAHTLKAEGVPEFSTRPQARALLLTALAEIHANAVMFGGMESTSFKIKWKSLNQRGKAVLSLLRTTADV